MRTPFVAALAALLSAAACNQDALTEIVVVADTTLRVPEAIDRIRFVVDAAMIDMTMQTSNVDLTTDRPAIVGLVHEGGALGPLTIIAEGRLGSDRIVSRRAVVSFEAGQVRMLRLDLFAECLEVDCRGGLTCADDGDCRTEDHSLVDWTGEAARLDPGTTPQMDAGTDAAMPTDAGLDAPTVDSSEEADTSQPDASVCDALVLDVVVGENHGCAVSRSDAVFCWGMNGFGQLGIGNNDAFRSPVRVGVSVDSAVQLAAGAEHSCARLRDGTVSCWGRGADGRLGNNSVMDRLTPSPVTDLTDVSVISAGRAHTCAASQGSVFCWGSDTEGQLGGDGTMQLMPSQVPGLPSDISAVSAGEAHTCATTTAGDIWCWGNNNDSQLGIGPATPKEFPSIVDLGADNVAASVAAGGRHTCALQLDGMVRCWGYGASGQLGSGRTQTQTIPSLIETLSDVVSLTAGAEHTCAVDSEGAAFCWGANGDFQLGDGTVVRRLTPTSVGGSADFGSISAGLSATCARRTSGMVTCWGTGPIGVASASGMVPVTFELQ